MYSLILFLAAIVGERNKSAAELSAEKDDKLHAEMVAESDNYYRDLIRKGGRNVVKARQVLSTSEAAMKQEQLLAALEGSDMAPVAAIASPSPAAADEDDDESADGTPPMPGRMRFTRKKADAVERWALGDEAQE